MRKLLLSVAMALVAIAVLAEDASACFRRRWRNPAPCPYPCYPVTPMPYCGPAGPGLIPESTAGSIAELLKVLEPAKPPEVPADLAKLLGLKPGKD